MGVPRNPHSQQPEEAAAHLDACYNSDQDILITRDNYHDWVVANERMAKALAAKGYPYQFVFAKNAVHCDRGVKAQTLPLALEYVSQEYTPKK